MINDTPISSLRPKGCGRNIHRGFDNRRAAAGWIIGNHSRGVTIMLRLTLLLALVQVLPARAKPGG